MSNIQWMEVLGWGKKHIEDMRFIGNCYVKQGKYDIAITFFEALCLLSNTTFDKQTMGALYLQIGKNNEALTYLDQALKEMPDHLPTQLNRAKALFSLGNKEEATAQAKPLLKAEDLRIASQASSLLVAFE